MLLYFIFKVINDINRIYFLNIHLIAPCHVLIVGTDLSCTHKGYVYPALEYQGMMTTKQKHVQQ